ncbi:hypothetical protein M5D96_013903 [Drosophila gunungcola]|uniref:Uncharacterized protein n=1 Tax=Drosophila gunungcola TaxID=103775 RepID=A0A9Q0BJ51_9MUSC|nr:hypothetical protein M5D96_013903 [Drosophila gunungcola]
MTSIHTRRLTFHLQTATQNKPNYTLLSLSLPTTGASERWRKW